MKTIYVAVIALFSTISFSQSHQIVKHNGEKLDVNYIKTTNNVVYYTFSGSTAEQEISKFAVEKLIDKTTNQSVISTEKLGVTSKSDYKNVKVLQVAQTTGLKKVDSTIKSIVKIKGQSPMALLEWTENSIKRDYAAKGYPFVTLNQIDDKLEAVAYTY